MSDPNPLHAESATDLDIRMMDRAIELAEQASEIREVPVGAVVYHPETGEILAEAYNTRECDRNPAGHAEFSAILKASEKVNDWRLNEYALAVTLEPCPMCSGLIVNARVGRVVFGALDPKAGAVRSLYELCDDPRLNHRATIISGVHQERCSEMLKAFFRSLRS